MLTSLMKSIISVPRICRSDGNGVPWAFKYDMIALLTTISESMMRRSGTKLAFGDSLPANKSIIV